MIGVFSVYIRPADEELRLPLLEVGVRETVDSGWQVRQIPEQAKEKKTKKLKRKQFLCTGSIIILLYLRTANGSDGTNNYLIITAATAVASKAVLLINRKESKEKQKQKE